MKYVDSEVVEIDYWKKNWREKKKKKKRGGRRLLFCCSEGLFHTSLPVKHWN
jgi:hypothetical protein